MPISNQILFFLAALGVFNGFLLALYFLFVAKPKRWLNTLFGLLMLMLCIRIGKSVFHVFMDLDRIYLQIGLSACMMIGPFLFLYVRGYLSKTKSPGKWDWGHILVPLGFIVTIGMIWPYEVRPDIWNGYVVKVIYSFWALYMVGATVALVPIFNKLFKRETTLAERWVLLVYSCVMLLCIAYISAYFGFPYLAGPLLFSVVLYVLMAFLASKKNRSAAMEEAPIKYQHQKVSESKAEALLQRLSKIMKTEQPYLNRKIKLADIATAIDATPHEVSQVINDRLGISFNTYLNEFRVKAACRMLMENDHLTVEGIGQEVGFNSRSAFYAAFKAVMKQTPAKYKAEVKVV